MYFASDTTSPVHPRVMQALAKANDTYMPSYGSDPIMDDVRARIRDVFEAPKAAVYLVATGSTANSLALATYCPPWGSIYCHRLSHIEVDECGAPEFYTGGAKLKLVDGEHAKMTPDTLRSAIEATPKGDVHSVQPGAVSITNVTERGTVYTTAEIAALCKVAKDHDLPCHMDGARFANAIVTTGATPAEMTWRAGIDVLSFGGTKNGLMGVEAVIFFDPAKAWEFELRRKRGGHLFSKHRYLSAQMQAYLTDDLWLETARAANRSGMLLSKGLSAIDGVDVRHPTQANMVFAQWPKPLHLRALQAGAAYEVYPEGAPIDAILPARLVCSWSTSDDNIGDFLDLLKG